MPRLDSQNIVLQERDISLLADLLESRVLTLDHIRTLYFPGKNEMAKKRVQRLKGAGLISERSRRIGQPSVLHITWKGYIALREGCHVGGNAHLTAKTFARRMAVSDLTLTHELMIADVRTTFTIATRESGRFSLLAFDVWPRRYNFTVSNGYNRVNVKPDGHLRFVEKRNDEEFQYDFFVEVDTGSETLDRVVEKCVNYREYHRSGGYAVFCGGKKDESKAYPFRVLLVCRSEARRNNLAARLQEVKPVFSTMILVTTQSECVRDPLGDIWLTAAAYKLNSGSVLCSICE
jgi:Replication-relaxation